MNARTLDQDHSQWQAVLEAIDEAEARIPDSDSYADSVRRYLAFAARRVRQGDAINRQQRTHLEGAA